MRRLLPLLLCLLLLAACGRTGAEETPTSPPSPTPVAPFWTSISVIPRQVRYAAVVMGAYPQVYSTGDEGRILALIGAMDMESWTVLEGAPEPGDGLMLSLTYSWGERFDLLLDEETAAVYQGRDTLVCRLPEGCAGAVRTALADITLTIRARGTELAALALGGADRVEIVAENQMGGILEPGGELVYDDGLAVGFSDPGTLLGLRALLNPNNWGPDEPAGLGEARSVRVYVYDGGAVSVTLDVFADDILLCRGAEGSLYGDFYTLPAGTYDAVLELIL